MRYDSPNCLSALPTRPLELADGTTIVREDGLPLMMGVVNVTPDSFSDGGRFMEPDSAIQQALELVAEGADIIDIGAESTRPGADPVGEEEEWRRLEPIIAPLAAATECPISVDTRRSAVARRALDAGAGMVNDVCSGQFDKGMFAVAASAGVPLCLMHMRGEPGNMQDKPVYEDVVAEVRAYLADRAEAAKKAGVVPANIIVDPGFGFGKLAEHNLSLVRGLSRFRDLGLVLLGLSRKSTLATVSQTEDRRRLPESIAGAIAGARQGADILRVHEVGATIRALRVARLLEMEQPRQ